MDRIVAGNFVNLERYIFVSFFFSLLKYIQNSAIIIVQNQITGLLEEEKMLDWGLGCCIRAQQVAWKADEVCYFPWSVFLTVDPFIARRLLKSLSIKQGIKYDAPESALDIAPFIAFHGLNVDEILDPPDSFSTLVNIFSIATPN